MEKQEQIYEGKTKNLFSTDNPDVLIISYKDEIVSSTGEKKAVVADKGFINNQMSNQIFSILEKNGVPTHFIEEIGERESAIKKLSMLPLIVRVRNYASADFKNRTGVEEGKRFAAPILEFALKNEALNNPMINGYYVLAMEIATREEIDKITTYAFKINEVLEKYFSDIGIDLIDFKLEFGKDSEGNPVLADEISPDTCRLWDKETHEKLDKDRFSRDLGNVEEAYKEVYNRLKKSRE